MFSEIVPQGAEVGPLLLFIGELWFGWGWLVVIGGWGVDNVELQVVYVQYIALLPFVLSLQEKLSVVIIIEYAHSLPCSLTF